MNPSQGGKMNKTIIKDKHYYLPFHIDEEGDKVIGRVSVRKKDLCDLQKKYLEIEKLNEVVFEVPFYIDKDGDKIMYTQFIKGKNLGKSQKEFVFKNHK